MPALAISSTDCRDRVVAGEPVWYLVPDGVVQYIGKHGLYRGDGGADGRHGHRPRERLDDVTATDRAVELTVAAAEAAADKLAEEIVALDVSDQLVITDCFVLAAADNDRQVRAIVVEAIEERLSSMGAKPIRREGLREGRWVLLDYGEIVVHVQHAEDRAVLRPRAALEGLPGRRAARSPSGTPR